MHTCLTVYVCASVPMWKPEEGTDCSPLFFITLNQGILLNLGLGLLDWLVASNLGIFLIPSHSVLGQ